MDILRLVSVILVVILVGSSIALILVSADASFATTVEPSTKPVFAYYYGWYTKGAWYGGIDGSESLSVADVPSIGMYNSQNVSVIDTQISEAISAGIDGFIASWWGPGSFTDNTDQILINQAETKYNGFSISLYFETEIIQNMNSSFPVEQTQFVKDVAYIMQGYTGNDAFARINRDPVLFISGVDDWPLQFWTNVTSEIHQLYPSLLLISDSLDIDYLSAFDGAASYVDLGYMTQSLTLQNGTYPTFTQLSQLAKSEGKYWFATASPGFNGTNDGKTQFVNVPRDDGETFTIGWDIAQNSDPYGIIVGTWNEYYEGTSIEPAQSYGNFYLQLTSQLSEAWNSNGPHFRFASRIYPLELDLY